MSCENNQSAAGGAGKCSGIPAPASKSANYTGKILLAGLLLGGAGLAIPATVTGIKRIQGIMDGIKEAEAEQTRRREIASRWFVQMIQNPRRREMIVELQSKYLGRTILRRDISRALGVGGEFEFEEGLYFETKLDKDIRVAVGPYGKMVYSLDADNRQRGRILTIEPNVGDEGAVRNGLAAYASPTKSPPVQPINEEPPSEITPNAPLTLTGALKDLKKWAGENREELSRVATYAIPAAVIWIGGHEIGVLGRVKLTPVGKMIKVTQMGAQLHQDIEAIREAKLATQQLAQKLKDPLRVKSVVALQKKYVGTSLPLEELVSLMGRKPRLFVDDTWYVQGALGAIYYTPSGGNGEVSIQAILPEAGYEPHLHQGLKAIARG